MWHPNVLAQFEIASHGSRNYLQPYSMLLNYIFDRDGTSHFVVGPQFFSNSNVAWVEVRLFNKPLLILTTASPSHLQVLSKRQAADNRIRALMTDQVGDCPLEKFYGISALGTKLYFYELDKTRKDAQIMPPIAGRTRSQRDTAPIDRWALDILEPDGEERLREISEYLKAECAPIADSIWGRSPAKKAEGDLTD